MRVHFDELKSVIRSALTVSGMKNEKADTCARVHAESSLDGVYSHGLNRVPRFIAHLRDGWVNPDAEPVTVHGFGCMENRDGMLGPGITNALSSIDRACMLAKDHGIGLVTLKNTTHWMRGGTYSWRAADRGFLSVCWTNSEPCMPAWGARSIVLGNNPLCIGIPSASGHVILDMAMSLYSYGKLETSALAGKELPYPGGWDDEGNLSTDPFAVLKTQRLLPAGLWKGSGLAVALDLAAAILSNGLTTDGIGKKGMGNSGCSQVFMAIHPEAFCKADRMEELVTETKESLRRALPETEGERVSYPGERTLETRKEHMANGIPVDPVKWDELRRLAGI